MKQKKQLDIQAVNEKILPRGSFSLLQTRFSSLSSDKVECDSSSRLFCEIYLYI